MSEKDLTQLNSQEEIAKFNLVFDYIVSADAVGEAKRFSIALSEIFTNNPGLNKSNPSLFATFSNYLIAAKFVILFDLEEQEIFSLLREHFDFVLNHPDYDLYQKLRYKIKSIIDLDKRDIFKHNVRETLLKCDVRLGKKKIIISGFEQEATIANWLKDYYIKVGIDKADSLKINEYLVNDSNIKTLTAEEKNKLKKIFILSENLKISSKEFPMFEENFSAISPNGEISLASEGKLEKVDENILKIYKEVSVIGNEAMPATSSSSDDLFLPEKPGSQPMATKSVPTQSEIKPLSPLEELEQTLKNYSESSFEHKALRQEISRLKKSELTKAQHDVKK